MGQIRAGEVRQCTNNAHSNWIKHQLFISLKQRSLLLSQAVQIFAFLQHEIDLH